MRWREEIEQLHEFFEAYLSGAEISLERAEAVLAPEFTIVGADGDESDRESTMRLLLDGHAQTRDLTISWSVLPCPRRSCSPSSRKWSAEAATMPGSMSHLVR